MIRLSGGWSGPATAGVIYCTSDRVQGLLPFHPIVRLHFVHGVVEAMARLVLRWRIGAASQIPTRWMAIQMKTNAITEPAPIKTCEKSIQIPRQHKQ